MTMTKCSTPPLLTGRQLGFPLAVPETTESLEKRLITAKSALTRIGPELKQLEDQIKVIRSEFEYWWRVNQQCERKLAAIRKVAPGVSGKPKANNDTASVEKVIERLRNTEHSARLQMIAELQKMLEEV